MVFTLCSVVDYFRQFWDKVDSGMKLRRRHDLITPELQKRCLHCVDKIEAARAAKEAQTYAKSQSQASS